VFILQAIAKSESNSQVFRTSLDALEKSFATYSATVDRLKDQLAGMKPKGTDNGESGTGAHIVSVNDDGDDDSGVPELQQYFKEELNRQSDDLTALNTSVWHGFVDLWQQHQHNTVLLLEVKNATQQLESRVGLLEVGLSTRQNNTSTPDMHALVTQAVSSVMEELRNASIDSGAEAMGALEDRMNEITRTLSNTSQFDSLTQKQKMIAQDVIILQHSVSQLANTVTSNEQRITLVEAAEHSDHEDGEDDAHLGTGKYDVEGGNANIEEEKATTAGVSLATDDTGGDEYRIRRTTPERESTTDAVRGTTRSSEEQSEEASIPSN